MEYQQRRYNQMKQKIETRPVNRGAEITDHLPTVKVEPDGLNMWSEIEPVKELITGMANKFLPNPPLGTQPGSTPHI